MINPYTSVRDSLFKVCSDFKTANTWTATNYNFDAFSENNALPAGDLIGLRGLTLDVDTDLMTVKGMFGIATQGDENLFRLDKLGGLLLKYLAPGTRIDIYDVDQTPAVVAGKMLIGAGTSISPVYQAVQRPLKFLSFTGFLDYSLSQP